MSDPICTNPNCKHLASEHSTSYDEPFGCGHDYGSSICDCSLIAEQVLLSAALARIATLEAALKEVDAKLSYLQKLWGKEGLTDGLVDQIRAALEPKP